MSSSLHSRSFKSHSVSPSTRKRITKLDRMELIKSHQSLRKRYRRKRRLCTPSMAYSAHLHLPYWSTPFSLSLLSYHSPARCTVMSCKMWPRMRKSGRGGTQRRIEIATPLRSQTSRNTSFSTGSLFPALVLSITSRLERRQSRWPKDRERKGRLQSWMMKTSNQKRARKNWERSRKSFSSW